MNSIESVVTKRYRFHRSYQHPDESIADFVLKLQIRFQQCQFDAAFQQEVLREQFVAGVLSSNLRIKLLAGPQLTFGRACAMALNWETSIEKKQVANRGGKIQQETHTKASDETDPSGPYCFQCIPNHASVCQQEVHPSMRTMGRHEQSQEDDHTGQKSRKSSKTFTHDSEQQCEPYESNI